ncbi:MAG TPA: hypothetical protein VET30_05895 [Pseudoxanthomonas sp.]|nr:hypothetical protein [Pseudoxanthomonas sp.]
MINGYFFARDLAGNTQKVHVIRQAAMRNGHAAMNSQRASYALDDGSMVKRIDSDTFLVVDTGAYVTLMRE